jgi:hypothetical protein
MGKTSFTQWLGLYPKLKLIAIPLKAHLNATRGSALSLDSVHYPTTSVRPLFERRSRSVQAAFRRSSETRSDGSFSGSMSIFGYQCQQHLALIALPAAERRAGLDDGYPTECIIHEEVNNA